MKILQVCPRYYPNLGGVEEHVRNLSERLGRTNDVTVATTDPSGRLSKNESINGIKVLRFKSWAPMESYFFSGKLRSYLANNACDFDVVHAHSYHAFPALYAAKTKGKNKLVFTSHYNGPGHTPFRHLLHRFYKSQGAQIFRKADRIISVSKYEKNLILKHFKVDDNKIVVIPNGLNLEEFRGLEKRTHLNKTIVYSGRLEKYKGAQYLIEVLGRLDDDIQAVIIGKGPYKNHLTKLARKLGVDNRVRFLQDLPRRELLQIFADADLFVTLSKYECYGLTVAESLASRTPCIVADNSALSEWIDNERCLGVAYPINVTLLAELISAVIGRQVRKLECTDWIKVAESVYDVYVNVLKEPVT